MHGNKGLFKVNRFFLMECMTEAQVNNLRRWELEECEWKIAQQLRDILQVRNCVTLWVRTITYSICTGIRVLPSALITPVLVLPLSCLL